MNTMQTFNRRIGGQMARRGRMAMIETRGRVSGRPIATPVGWAAGPEEVIWIGAGSADSHWPRNLLAEAQCRMTIGTATQTYRAEELTDERRQVAVATIRDKYGAPASRVGTGPVFALHPVQQEQPSEPATGG